MISRRERRIGLIAASQQAGEKQSHGGKSTRKSHSEDHIGAEAAVGL
jgi:hypothetical protein